MAAFNFEFWINKNLPGKCLDVMMHLKTPGGLPAVVQPVALTTITPEMEARSKPRPSCSPPSRLKA